jgi:hypothetical protein
MHEAGALRVANGHCHLPYDDFKLSHSAPLIGIYRDVRDVIVSAYYLNERRKAHGRTGHIWLNDLTDGKDPSDAVMAMCRDEEHDVLGSYLDWFLGFTGKPHVMLLRFEHVTQYKYGVFDALHGMGFNVPRHAYDNAWQAYAYKRLRKAHPEHYRTGGRSTWVEELDDKVVRCIEQKCAAFFELTGYPVVAPLLASGTSSE